MLHSIIFHSLCHLEISTCCDAFWLSAGFGSNCKDFTTALGIGNIPLILSTVMHYSHHNLFELTLHCNDHGIVSYSRCLLYGILLLLIAYLYLIFSSASDHCDHCDRSDLLDRPADDQTRPASLSHIETSQETSIMFIFGGGKQKHVFNKTMGVLQKAGC